MAAHQRRRHAKPGCDAGAADMSDQPIPAASDQPIEPIAAAPNPRKRNLVPWLYGLGFLVLAAACLYLWEYPSAPAENVADTSAIHAVEQHLTEIDARLSRMEQRPAADLGNLPARVDALNGRISDQAQLASRMDTLSGRIESLSGRGQSGIDAVKQQLDVLAGRLTALESQAGSLAAVSKRMDRIGRLQEASFALASGKPIGEIPNAPEALTRYAHAAPPTEAQLRLDFPRSAQAALAAKQPDKNDAPFIDRVWEKAQGLVTIRQGSDIVVGNSAATVLNHAQAALEAGDLAGAIATLEALKGQPAQAMADWVDNAKSLLSARSALAEMADQA